MPVYGPFVVAVLDVEPDLLETVRGRPIDGLVGAPRLEVVGLDRAVRLVVILPPPFALHAVVTLREQARCQPSVQRPQAGRIVAAVLEEEIDGDLKSEDFRVVVFVDEELQIGAGRVVDREAIVLAPPPCLRRSDPAAYAFREPKGIRPVTNTGRQAQGDEVDFRLRLAEVRDEFGIIHIA